MTLGSGGGTPIACPPGTLGNASGAILHPCLHPVTSFQDGPALLAAAEEHGLDELRQIVNEVLVSLDRELRNSLLDKPAPRCTAAPPAFMFLTCSVAASRSRARCEP